MRRISRSESVARTRARLLEAAEAVFAENGFGEASLSQIADRNRFLLLTEFRLYALRNPAIAPRLADYERRSLAWYTEVIQTRVDATGVALPAAQLATLVLALENGIATLAHLAPDDVAHHAFIDALELLSTMTNNPPG